MGPGAKVDYAEGPSVPIDEQAQGDTVILEEDFVRASSRDVRSSRHFPDLWTNPAVRLVSLNQDEAA
jgi:hypothetical protein